MTFDLLTVGEAMIRLSVPAGDLLMEAPAYDVNVAGAESNVAVAVARMGFRSRWLSRLTDNVLGRRIVSVLNSYGVDCSQVEWTAEDRVGTYFLEFGSTPRPTQVTYDRKYSAASKMGPQTFDLAQVAEARILHLTGITAAISDSCYAMLEQLIDMARTQGIHIVFDVNFRRLLWTPQTCEAKLSPLLTKVNTLLLSRQDAETVFNVKGEPEQMLQAFRDRFGMAQIAITTGAEGAVGLANGVMVTAPGYPVHIVDRIGAGDAFAAGVICGLLSGDFASGMRYGVAMSALQLSLKGDLFRLGRAEVEQLMNTGIASRPIR